jgi:hypothetical protein
MTLESPELLAFKLLYGSRTVQNVFLDTNIDFPLRVSRGVMRCNICKEVLFRWNKAVNYWELPPDNDGTVESNNHLVKHWFELYEPTTRGNHER